MNESTLNNLIDTSNDRSMMMRNRNNSNNFFIQHWQQNSSDNFDKKFYEIFDHMSSPTPPSTPPSPILLSTINNSLDSCESE